jgi:hypothetical protein
MTGRDSAPGLVRVYHCVSAMGAWVVPVFVCLRSGFNHLTEVGGP